MERMFLCTHHICRWTLGSSLHGPLSQRYSLATDGDPWPYWA